MKNSEFWVMVKRNDPAQTGKSSSDYPGSSLPSIFIVEVSPDEIVYLWPYKPHFDSLCLVCKNYHQRCFEVCKAHVPKGYPCNFQAVPEAEVNQDFDDFLIDGEFIAECGYYYSFDDFLRQNGFSDKHFLYYRIGTVQSIRGARHQLLITHQKLAPFNK